MTCRILYEATYDEIKQKTGVGHWKIVTRAIKQAECEDIYEVLAYVGDLDRSGWIPWVADDTELSQDIWNAILNNLKLKFPKAMIDKENITIPRILEGKKPVESIIKNVQYQHSHKVDSQKIGNIIYINKIVEL